MIGENQEVGHTINTENHRRIPGDFLFYFLFYRL